MIAKVSILSERTNIMTRPTVAGRIRPGTKRLTNEAANDPRACQIVDQMRAQGAKTAAIEKAISDTCGINHPFYPHNTPWFNLTASDFSPPELAQMILNRYGEVRPEHPQKRLYRFPMVLGSGVLDAVLPHQFRQGTGEEGFESRYVNGQRQCFWLTPVDASQVQEQRRKRIKRVPPRQKQVRGPCEPGICDAYGSERCKFNATLLFYIPDIPSGLPIAMDTSSSYAAEGLWQALDGLVQQLGEIPRCHPESGKPLYWLEKRQERRSFFNADGQRQSRDTWVPFLVVDVDMSRLLRRNQLPLPPQVPQAGIGTGETQPAQASQAIIANTGNPMPEQADAQHQRVVPLAVTLGIDPDLALAYLKKKLGAQWDNPARIGQELSVLADLAKLPAGCGAMLIKIGMTLLEQSISQESFRAYAKHQFGNGFVRQINALNTLYEVVSTQPKTILGLAT